MLYLGKHPSSTNLLKPNRSICFRKTNKAKINYNHETNFPKKIRKYKK